VLKGKLKYPVAAFTLFCLLSSCIREESRVEAYGSSEEIYFNPAPLVKSGSGTKANSDLAAYREEVPFVSYAWMEDESKTPYINGEVVFHHSVSSTGSDGTTTTRSLWRTDKAYLWPMSFPLTFKSYSPAFITSYKTYRRLTSGGQFEVVYDKVNVDYDNTLEGYVNGGNIKTAAGDETKFTAPTYSDGLHLTNWNVDSVSLKYLDLMEADVQKSLTSVSGSNGVPTIFRHPLAQVGVMFCSNAFTLDETTQKMKVEKVFLVESVYINSVYTEGNCKPDSGSWTWDNLGPKLSWKSSGDTKLNGGVEKFVLYDANSKDTAGNPNEGFNDNSNFKTFSDVTVTDGTTTTATTSISGIYIATSDFTAAGYYRMVIPQELVGNTLYDTDGKTEKGSREAPMLHITYYEGVPTSTKDTDGSSVTSWTKREAKTIELHSISGNNSALSTNKSEYWEVGKRTTYYITFGSSNIPITFDQGDLSTWSPEGGGL